MNDNTKKPFGVETIYEGLQGGLNVIEPIAQMNGKYFDEDDFGLFDEFELMLDDLDKLEMSETSECSHKWEKVGSSPYTGIDWINCSKCDMRREDYDYDQKYNKPPPIKTENKNVNLWGI